MCLITGDEWLSFLERVVSREYEITHRLLEEELSCLLIDLRFDYSVFEVLLYEKSILDWDLLPLWILLTLWSDVFRKHVLSW